MTQLFLFPTSIYELCWRISPTATYTIAQDCNQYETYNNQDAVNHFLSLSAADEPIEIYRLDPYKHKKLNDIRYNRILIWQSDAAYAISKSDNFEIEPKHLHFLSELQ